MTDFTVVNGKAIEEFRANGGKIEGSFPTSPLVLVHVLGARSGAERVVPLIYLADGGRLFIFASKAGSPENPRWHDNLLAYPEVTVEIGEETVRMRATELEGTERDEIYAKQIAAQPHFGEYQAMTDRVIPVLELVRC
jgi:deazaflavin-dependent oxidoreductase (nitroreductase family)